MHKSTGMNQDEKYMYRALQLAQLRFSSAMPNPSVGAVIVHKDTIIGEGFTSAYGGAHAEVNAIHHVQNQELLKESTLYVTLEPCSHYGKTPPCSLLLIEKKIKKVVIGTLDPYVEVAGKGVQQLQAHGIEVVIGVLEKECRESNKRFFTYHEKRRPYIILKWAQSADGFLAPLSKTEQKPVWISSAYSRQLTHKWRSEEQAILVGTTTVIDDNPSLTTRNWYGKNPIRMYIDRYGKIGASFQITNNQAKSICLIEKIPSQKLEHVHYEVIDFSAPLPQQIAKTAFKHQIQSIIIEGGCKTIQQFIDAHLWDEARIFESRHAIGEGILAPPMPSYNSKSIQKIASDQYILLKNK